MKFTKLMFFALLLTIIQTEGSKKKFPPNGNRPNFIFILTDDQDIELGGVIPLKKTRRLLSKKGATFKNMFVTTPLCCPSRASILTGLYTHNHGVVNNSVSGNCSSKLWQTGFERKTFITYLKKENYTTFYAGKYLNQYGCNDCGGISHIPPGWDYWIGLIGNSKYYNYTLSVNGKPEIHRDNTSLDYLTTVINTKASQFLKSYKSSQHPFFMMLAPPSPHKPYIPEMKYKKMFNNKHAPRTPNFKIHSGKDKHWLLRQPPTPFPEKLIEYIDYIFRERWRTLLSVDDMIENLVNILKEKHILQNTYIIFSSDNGFHLGQFSLPEDKRQLYEFDIRVPLFIRGPGIKPKLIMEPVLNIDLAPTFMELAGINITSNMDGTSLVNLLHKKTKPWRHQFFIEHKGEAANEILECPQYFNAGVHTCEVGCICEDSWNNTYSCLRILSSYENAICCIFKDNENFTESYNLTADPFQLNNLGNLGRRFCSKYRSEYKFLQNILELIS